MSRKGFAELAALCIIGMIAGCSSPSPVEHLPPAAPAARPAAAWDHLQQLAPRGATSSPGGTHSLVAQADTVRAIWTQGGKHRRFRVTAAAREKKEAPLPFAGGVLAYHPDRITLCGETNCRGEQAGAGVGDSAGAAGNEQPRQAGSPGQPRLGADA